MYALHSLLSYLLRITLNVHTTRDTKQIVHSNYRAFFSISPGQAPMISAVDFVSMNLWRMVTVMMSFSRVPFKMPVISIPILT